MFFLKAKLKWQKRKQLSIIKKKYKKENVIDKRAVLNLITNEINKITIEMWEQIAYSNDTEEVAISMRY